MKTPGLILVGMLLSPSLVPAQDQELELEMFFASEETVTSAARHEQDIGMSPSAITIFTREDIETTGAATVPDLLRLVPGMDVITISPAFTAITSRLYWTNENNLYLVLIDGREMNLELMGEPPWEILPVSLEDIERIEVIRGPGSSLYGPNAVAGVISITTRPVAEKTSAFLGFTGGEIGSSHLGARASTRLWDWGFPPNGGFERSGTFTDHRTESKRVYRLRGTSEYRLSLSQHILLEPQLDHHAAYHHPGLRGHPAGRLRPGDHRRPYGRRGDPVDPAPVLASAPADHRGWRPGLLAEL